MWINIWIVWATWAVWIEILECLKKLNVKFDNLKLGASVRSAWKTMGTSFWNLVIEEVNDDFFDGLDYVIFSAGWNISKMYARIANDKWVVVIDNSSVFRYEDNVPLIIPQINSEEILDAKIIANPNCTTAIAAVVLYPIYKKYWIKKIIMSTYQATSWAWTEWMQELIDNTKEYLDKKESKSEYFVHNIAFNVIPHIDKVQENMYTKEEMKVVWETRKIFNDNHIKISCTAVRIPTLRAHSESIVLETEKDVNIEDIKNILEKAPWVKLTDDIDNNIYPMPMNATWNHDVEVWRIRKNLVFWDNWLELFVSWDQLLRWAALNAVEILIECMKRRE